MTQQPEGIRREVDLHGITPALAPVRELPPPDEFTQAVHFIALTIILYLLYAICTSASFTILRNSGFYDWNYGHDFVATAQGSQSPEQQAALTRLQLWAVVVALPCWLVPTALLCLFLPTAYRHDIGVSVGRFPRWEDRGNVNKAKVAAWSLLVNGLIGVAAWVVIAPLAFGVNLLLVWLYSRFTKIAPEEHPFTATVQSGGMRQLEWCLLAVGVMVSAPLWEELLFRGLLPAVARKLGGTGGYAALMLALAAALLLRRQPIAEALTAGRPVPLLFAVAPVLFVLAMLPLYTLVCWLSRAKDVRIVFGTAVLFGAVHSFAWPTPVALFVLGLGLGWLAVWTRSLIAPVVVHALFNAVSFALLYFGLVTM
jgi:membrane protease YdiL (CAAX protease family)